METNIIQSSRPILCKSVCLIIVSLFYLIISCMIGYFAYHDDDHNFKVSLFIIMILFVACSLAYLYSGINKIIKYRKMVVISSSEYEKI